jgi:prepilin-type N-terminal cleavage/methylation domain-containing protein
MVGGMAGTPRGQEPCSVRLAPRGGYSLIEMLVAMAIAGILIAGMVSGHIQAAKQAEWSAYSLAASSLALQQLERIRGAKWDSQAANDQVISGNFPVTVEILDIPITKTNIVYATNRTTITTISTAPPLKMVRVDCTWRFMSRAVSTNSVATYRAPDQ